MKSETDISPRIVNGEPTCSGEECPNAAPWDHWNVQCYQLGDSGRCSNLVGINTTCLLGLRRQRDELHEKNKEAVVALVAHSENETRLLNASIQACAERDAARRELCSHYAGIHSRVRADLLDSSWHHFENVLRRYAASRNWSYLYETPEGGEG